MGFQIKLGTWELSAGKNRQTQPEQQRHVNAYKDNLGNYTYELQTPDFARMYRGLLYGTRSKQNLIELFHSIPEIFAPIHEIASRVSQSVWELKSVHSDKVDYNNRAFNKLFSQPNPINTITQHIYAAVCYELVTGEQYYYFNNVLGGGSLDNTVAWWNLRSQNVNVIYKNPLKLYTATGLGDFVDRYETTDGGQIKRFTPDEVLPVISTNLDWQLGPLEGKSPLLSAEKAITNLIAVYEARGAIYIKRGALGMIVSRKADESGQMALTPKEKQNLVDDYNTQYGLGAGQSPVAITNQPVDFIQMGMSIKDLEPFGETSADADAIYSVLRVPKHLQPHRENSTYANQAGDVKSFYSGVIIPMAKAYAKRFTDYFNTEEKSRYIDVNFTHVPELQDDRVKETQADKTEGDTYKQRWDNGLITLNEWITAFDGATGAGEMYNKKKFELTPEEMQLINPIIVDPNKPNTENGSNKPKDSQAKADGAGN